MARVLRRCCRARQAALLSVALAMSLPAATALARGPSSTIQRMDARAAAAAVGGFVPNRGQLPAGIRFAAIGPGYAIAFERHRVRLSLADGKSSVRVALRFVGAGATSTVETTGRQATR